MALFSSVGDFFRQLGFSRIIGEAAGLTGGQRFPTVPPVRRPPPPVARAAPPTRRDPTIQQAGADTRDLFRRRGRRTTIFTPGRGAGVTGGAAATGTRLLLGETAR